MGLLSGLSDTWVGKAAKTIAPFGGRLLGLADEDRKKQAPKQQYFGGSKEASDKARERWRGGASAGDEVVSEGIKRSQYAADAASKGYKELQNDAQLQRQRLTGYADTDRTSSLASQQKLEGIADTAQANYQQTAMTQANLDRDRNQQQALALGSTGGAGGLRTALASSTQANQQAAQQAQITQAQEQNQLMQMRAGIYGQSADMSAARENAARANALNYAGVQGNAVGGAYGAQANTAGQQIGAGTAERGQNIGAEVAQGQAELGAAREYEGQRQQNEKSNFTQDWFPLKRFNAP